MNLANSFNCIIHNLSTIIEHPLSIKEKSLELERLVFFSDEIFAIAMTLLVFDLKLTHLTGGHISFADLEHAWQKFVAFILSFVLIAIFWKIHHEFFSHIREISYG